MIRARTYQFGNSKLTLKFGDLTTSDAQVLVSSDDYFITMGGGVSAAILRAGGETIALDAAKKVPAALGDIIVTSAGTLPAQYIFHAITIGPNSKNLDTGAIIERTTRRCMQLLDGLQLSSIAFPAIGTGAAGFSYEEVAARMAEVIVDELMKRKTPVEATIFLFDRFGRMTEIEYIKFFEEFAARAPRVAKNVTPVPQTESAPRATSLALAAETEEEYKRHRLHTLRKLLADLEDQRGQLEQRLIALLGANDAGEGGKARQALKENQELRFQYLAELRSYAEQDTSRPSAKASRSSQPPTVFVSSTSRDLAEHRTAIKDAIARCDLLFRGMEHFGANADRLPPASVIVEEVKKADVYLGIFGVRYGSVDPATGLSMTELEFREAETSKKPMLLYAIHENSPVPVSHIEVDPEGYRKLATLKEYILSSYVSYKFRNVDDLARQAYGDLEKLKVKFFRAEA